MASSLSLEFEGVRDHVASRGNRREPIFAAFVAQGKWVKLWNDALLG